MLRKSFEAMVNHWTQANDWVKVWSIRYKISRANITFQIALVKSALSSVQPTVRALNASGGQVVSPFIIPLTDVMSGAWIPIVEPEAKAWATLLATLKQSNLKAEFIRSAETQVANYR